MTVTAGEVKRNATFCGRHLSIVPQRARADHAHEALQAGRLEAGEASGRDPLFPAAERVEESSSKSCSRNGVNIQYALIIWDYVSCIVFIDQDQSPYTMSKKFDIDPL